MNYLKALEHAIIYIEDHLTEPFSVVEAARYAGYSYYHLTRQFSAVLGESIGSYVRKRRLANAAKDLIYSDERILDIALKWGFESSEAFSRAFKSLYMMNPAAYRRNRLELFIGKKPMLDEERLSHLAENLTVQPVLTTLPDIKVAGLRGQTTLRDNVLPGLWAEFNSISHKIPDAIPGGRGFGICEACSEGNTLLNMNEDVNFSEIAGIEVSSLEHIKPPFTGKILKGGRYAVFTHKGSLSRLSETFEYIWGTWFLSAQEELDFREDFELYDERFLGYDHPESRIDLYIPVK